MFISLTESQQNGNDTADEYQKHTLMMRTVWESSDQNIKHILFITVSEEEMSVYWLNFMMRSMSIQEMVKPRKHPNLDVTEQTEENQGIQTKTFARSGERR